MLELLTTPFKMSEEDIFKTAKKMFWTVIQICFQLNVLSQIKLYYCSRDICVICTYDKSIYGWILLMCCSFDWSIRAKVIRYTRFSLPLNRNVPTSLPCVNLQDCGDEIVILNYASRGSSTNFKGNSMLPQPFDHTPAGLRRSCTGHGLREYSDTA